MSFGQRRMAMNYYWMSKYDIMTTTNEDYLIFKRHTATAPKVHTLPREQYCDVLSDISCSIVDKNYGDIISERTISFRETGKSVTFQWSGIKKM